jgi:hypothetical protein
MQFYYTTIPPPEEIWKELISWLGSEETYVLDEMNLNQTWSKIFTSFSKADSIDNFL